MPCISKNEAARPEMEQDGLRDVDAVITTRELGKMIKQAGIDYNSLPDEGFDSFMGDYTGAGVIFGATGGVMEAALRTVSDVLTGEDLKDIEYKSLRGTKDLKEATVKLGDLEVSVAVVHGTKAAGELLQSIRNKERTIISLKSWAVPVVVLTVVVNPKCPNTSKIPSMFLKKSFRPLSGG